MTHTMKCSFPRMSGVLPVRFLSTGNVTATGLLLFAVELRPRPRSVLPPRGTGIATSGLVLGAI